MATGAYRWVANSLGKSNMEVPAPARLPASASVHAPGASPVAKTFARSFWVVRLVGLAGTTDANGFGFLAETL